MRRGARLALRAGTAALLAAAALAALMSFIDWRLNPGGIFRDAERTHWPVVWETFASWLWPALLLFGPLALAAALLRARAMARRRARP